MMKHKKCPECGNKQLKKYQEDAVGNVVSAMTNKVLKDLGFQGANTTRFECKCGWTGEYAIQVS